MFDINFTFNGQPATSANIADQLERAIIDAAKENLQEKLRSVGITASGEGLTIDFKKDHEGNMDVTISGPAELLERAREILN